MLLAVVLSMLVKWSVAFDISNVQQLNSKINQLVDNMKTVPDCDELIATIRSFTGGLHVASLEILHLYNKTESLKIGKAIYDDGKPEFLLRKFDEEHIEEVCKWEIDEMRYFRKMIKDANNEWENFVSAYLKCKDTPIIPYNFKQCSIKY